MGRQSAAEQLPMQGTDEPRRRNFDPAEPLASEVRGAIDYLLTLTPEQEDRVLTMAMLPNPHFGTGGKPK